MGHKPEAVTLADGNTPNLAGSGGPQGATSGGSAPVPRPKDSHRLDLADSSPAQQDHVEITTLPSGAVLLTAPGGGARAGRATEGPEPVALQLWFRAGTRTERADEHGIAHLLEHMIFKPFHAPRQRQGEVRDGRVDLSQAIEALGGDVNAYTSHDETVFELSVDAKDVERAVDLLVHAVFRPALEAAELEKEREVVCEEIRQYDDDPASWAAERAMLLAYGEDGYARPVLGTIEEVASHTATKLANFHRRQYCLRNAVFVVVGRVARKKLSAWIERSIKRAAVPHKAAANKSRRIEPVQRPAALETVQRPVSEVHLRLQWVGPSLRDPESVALECAATILGEGEASRLAIRLRRGRGLISDGWAAFHWLRDAGGFSIAAHCKAQHEGAAHAAILAEVQRMRSLRVEPEELERAKATLRSAMVYRRETVGGLAGALGYAYVLGDSMDVERVYLERLATLTPDEVLHACQRWLAPERGSCVIVRPALSRRKGKAAPTRHKHIRSVPSVASAGPRIPSLSELAPGIERARFPGGPTVYLAHDDSVPMIAGTAAYRGGSFRETARHSGITNLGAALLTRGTHGRSGNELARELEGMAASVGGFCSRVAAGLSFESLASHRDVTLSRALACLSGAEFAEQEFLDEQRLTLEALAADEDDAGHVCLRLGLRAVYGSHPHGRMARGNPESVAKLRATQVRDHWFRHHPLAAASLAVAGDIDSSAVLHLIADALAGEGTGAAARTGAKSAQRDALPDIAPRRASLRGTETVAPWPRRPVHVHQHLDREQVYLNWLLPGVRIGDPRSAAMEILCTTLGASSGPLFAQLREEEGLVYDVGCASFEGLDRGHVSIWASTARSKLPKTVARIRRLMEQVAEQGVSRDGIAMAKELLVGGFVRSLQRRGRVANLIAASDALGLPPLRYLKYAERIRKATPASISALARQLFTAPPVLASVGARTPS